MNIKNILKNYWKMIFAFLYLLAPFDLIPDLVPLLGISDDVLLIIIALLLSYFDHKRKGFSDLGSVSEVRKKHSKVVEGKLVE